MGGWQWWLPASSSQAEVWIVWQKLVCIRASEPAMQAGKSVILPRSGVRLHGDFSSCLQATGPTDCLLMLMACQSVSRGNQAEFVRALLLHVCCWRGIGTGPHTLQCNPCPAEQAPRS